MAVAALCACTTAHGAAWLDQRDWRLETQEDSAVLTFRDGPERILALECHSQDPELGLMVWAPKPAAGATKPEQIILIAGGKRQIFPTLTEANRSYWEMMGHARKTDLVIRAFRATGRISIKIGDRSERLIPTHGNTAVADFFNWCH